MKSGAARPQSSTHTDLMTGKKLRGVHPSRIGSLNLDDFQNSLSGGNLD
jgi:hypothetical protein